MDKELSDSGYLVAIKGKNLFLAMLNYSGDKAKDLHYKNLCFAGKDAGLSLVVFHEIGVKVFNSLDIYLTSNYGLTPRWWTFVPFDPNGTGQHERPFLAAVENEYSHILN